MLMQILRFGLAMLAAFGVGKLVSKCKLPAILGWLLTGMVFGPYALSIVDTELMQANWYETLMHVLECTVGLMIGTELVWKKIKASGKAIIFTTLTQSLGTYFVVSAVFASVFWFSGTPLYLAFLFGGIALATAPAPALSIVKEFQTDGPVTRTLIPMAALDDMVGVVVFFITVAFVASSTSEQSLPLWMIGVVVLLPLVIGIVTGIPAGFLLNKAKDKNAALLVLSMFILLTSAVGFFFNHVVMPAPVLNFMLMGMSFSAAFANMISEEKLEELMGEFNPVLGVSLVAVILNLGAPLDYHLITGAGIYTAVYIGARAFGKYFGAWIGAALTHSPKTVQKYLGLTLLPHSGVSLVFTGVAVSVLAGTNPEGAAMIQGTIAAAAVINEIIAVLAAKKGFEWAGEFHAANTQEEVATELEAEDIPAMS